MGAFTGTGLVDGQTITTALSAPEVFSSFELLTDDGSGVPFAHLNFILFDENFNYVAGGADRVESTAATQHETLTWDITIPQRGYLFVYVSNESEWDVRTYFDELVINHEHLNVVQHDDYYPFGLAHDQNLPQERSNKYLYQGKERQFELGLGWDDFHARQYDAALGRWNSIDPKGELMSYNSPYTAMMNNPVYYIDPDGEFPIIPLALALVGAYAGGVHTNQGELNPVQWNWSGKGSWKTYAGVIGGGTLGWFGGQAVAAGDLTLKVGYGGLGGGAFVTYNGIAGTGYQWSTLPGGGGSLTGSNPVSAGDLLNGSNERLSVYTGGYQATDFNDPMQDYIVQHMIRSSGGTVIPNIDFYSYGGEGTVKGSSVYGKSYYSKLGVFTFLEGGAWGIGTVSAAYDFFEGVSSKYFNANAPAFKALNVLGKVTGAYSVFSHGMQAYDEYQKNGLSQQFYIDATRTAIDGAFLIYPGSKLIILGGSLLYNIGDTYYDIHFRK